MKLRATPFITILMLFTSLCVSARAYIWVTPPTQIDVVSMSTVEIVAADAPAESTPGEPVCNSIDAKFEIADAMRISSEKLREKVKSVLRPAYPPMARARHIKGQVIVEVLVAKAGEIICVRTLTGDPLLRETVLKAAKRWKFGPFEASDEVSNVVSTLAVNFKLR